MREYNLFDLDGTLTDPMFGITNAVMYALRGFGIEVSDRRELYGYIGPPLRWSFAHFHGLSEADAGLALRRYREYYADKGKFENTLYEGMEKLLDALRAAGARLIVATSKPEEFSREILEHFGILDRFDFIGGNTLDETRPTKIEVLDYVIKSRSGINPDTAVMIGDRHYDILGAKHFGLASVGVLYGYGSREELVTAGADSLAENVAELEDLLLGL